MANEFNLPLMVDEIGAELVAEFGKASRHGTTPDAIGQAKEKAVLDRLGSLFPPCIKVGSGHVIDANGNTSRQMDIVITEGQLCPEFRISNDPTRAYYPCQSVIAVGEIKSRLGKNELQDIWEKSASVRKPRRYSQIIGPNGENERAWLRPYGSSTLAPRKRGNMHDQDRNSTDQIFVFGLAGQLGAGHKAIHQETKRLLAKHGAKNAPNIVGALTGRLFLPTSKPDSSGMITGKTSYLEADQSSNAGPNIAVFRWIVFKIWSHICHGYTSPAYEIINYFRGPRGWQDLSDQIEE